MKNRLMITLAIAVFSSTVAAAQTARPLANVCPAHYELIGGAFCLKFTNGDVLLPKPVAAIARCRGGYELMVENQCINFRTGDIVFTE
jgi:hypothetical protein